MNLTPETRIAGALAAALLAAASLDPGPQPPPPSPRAASRAWVRLDALEIERDRVTAADLAPLMPEWRQLPGSTEVLYAPLPGLSRDLTRPELERLAARHALQRDPASDWPARLRISRRMRPLERSEAEAALAAAIGLRHGVSPEDVGVELASFASPSVPAGEIRFRTSDTFPRPGELRAVPLSWVTAEGRSGTLWLRARLTVRGLRAVAARPLAARAPIATGDVIFQEEDLAAPPDRSRLTPAELLGRSLSRSVAAGEKISRFWVVSPPAIERGGIVELRLSSGAIELRATGRAEQAGAIGQPLAFRNLDTGRRVTARLLDAGRAEVIPQRVVDRPAAIRPGGSPR